MEGVMQNVEAPRDGNLWCLKPVETGGRGRQTHTRPPVQPVNHLEVCPSQH